MRVAEASKSGAIWGDRLDGTISFATKQRGMVPYDDVDEEKRNPNTL